MKTNRSKCPINYALETFGDPWTLLIIRDILFFKKRTYGDFQKSGEKISTNILADRLNRLEKSGIIAKNKDDKDKKKWIYTLTQKGADLLPAILEIINWSAKYDSNTATPKKFIERLKKDRKKLIKNILSDQFKI